MSRYSQKHRQAAQCADAYCQDPGTKLVNLNGVLNWWCERHAAIMDRGGQL